MTVYLAPQWSWSDFSYLGHSKNYWTEPNDRCLCWMAALLVFIRFLPRCSYAGGISTRNTSVCLSNAWIVTKRKKLPPTFYTIWKNDHPSFPIRRMAGGERPLLTKILAQGDPPAFENADFQSPFARSTSASIGLPRE